MPKRISLALHLGRKELEQHYRQAKNGIESPQVHIIWHCLRVRPAKKWWTSQATAVIGFTGSSGTITS
jgi:hypothetical protein